MNALTKKFLKRTFYRLLGLALILVAIIATAIYPKLRNMSSEYNTAIAIECIENHLKKHAGQWPKSEKELIGRAWDSNEVVIDFSLTSAQILKNPGSLKKAVHPKSGKFYTYPHYERDLQHLLKVLQEAHPDLP